MPIPNVCFKSFVLACLLRQDQTLRIASINIWSDIFGCISSAEVFFWNLIFIIFLELEDFNNVVPIMELIPNKHLEISQLACCKAIPKCDPGLSSLPAQLPKHSVGETTLLFAWFVQSYCRNTKHPPSVLVPCVRPGNVYLPFHAKTESALTILQTPQNVNIENSNFIEGL